MLDDDDDVVGVGVVVDEEDVVGFGVDVEELLVVGSLSSASDGKRLPSVTCSNATIKFNQKSSQCIMTFQIALQSKI